jgi:hypothetical protein
MSPCRDSVIAGMMGMGSIIHPLVDFTEAACLSPNPTSEWITNLLQAITVVLIWHGMDVSQLTLLLLLITINPEKKRCAKHCQCHKKIAIQQCGSCSCSSSSTSQTTAIHLLNCPNPAHNNMTRRFSFCLCFWIVSLTQSKHTRC